MLSKYLLINFFSPQKIRHKVAKFELLRDLESVINTFSLNWCGCTLVVPLDETNLVAVRGLIFTNRFSPSVSASRARRSDTAMFDND